MGPPGNIALREPRPTDVRAESASSKEALIREGTRSSR